MMESIRGPWPWYVAGPLIGLLVPVLLLIGNRALGVSGTLRAICEATLPAKVSFFQYDWKRSSARSIAFVGGIVVGGAIAALALGTTSPHITSATQERNRRAWIGRARDWSCSRRCPA